MADSTSNIDPIVQSQAQKEVTANAFFDAASPATMFGRRASACGGLTWGYYGAKLLISGTPTNISNGTIALTASATNYIEVNRSGTVSKNTTGFTPGSLPLYTAVTNATSVTSWTDLRVTAITLDRYTQNNFAVTTADVTLTADQARCEYLYVTGALTGNRSIIVPLSWSGIIHNATTGAFTLTVKAASGLGVVVTQGTAALLYANGTDVVRQNSDARPGRLVKAMADAEHRSINNMIVALVERAAVGQDRSDSPVP